MSIQRKLAAAVCFLTVVFFNAGRLRAAGSTLRFVDSATGYAVRDAIVAPRDGQLSVSARGYETVALPAAITAESQPITVLLRPLDPPKELAFSVIDALRRPDATLIQGFVSDEAGAPLAGAHISAAGIADVSTNAEGFFRTWLPLSGDAQFIVHKDGYSSEKHIAVEVWSGGDWTYQLHLRRGGGTIVIDETVGRRRATPEREEPPPVQGALQVEAAPAALSLTPAVASVAPALPTAIRVPNSSGGIDYVDLETYCKRVLPAEWIPSWATLNGGFGADSLNAGAVAVRTYAVGYFKFPYASTYDICATTTCQVYNPSKVNSYTNAAVDQTASVVMVDGNSQIGFKATQYSAEDNSLGATSNDCGDGYTGDCISDPVCAGTQRDGHGLGMCQYGSARWASGLYLSTLTPHPYGRMNWQQILAHYYPSLQIATGQQLAIGDGVRVVNTGSTGLRVRACADGGIDQGTNCAALGTRFDGATGVLLSGPQRVSVDGNNYTWWKVRWDSDQLVGWSAENYLERTGTNCSFTLAPASQTLSGNAVSGTVSVTATSQTCAWSATHDAGSTWLTITSGSGTGSGTISFALQQNPSTTQSRTATISIGSSSASVTQQPAAACTFTLTPSSQNIPSATGSGSISVSASSQTCSWNAVRDSASWLTITSGSGTGNGTIAFTVQQNTTSQTRGSVITVGNASASVFQDALPSCAFTVTPTSASISGNAGSGSVSVVGTPSGCSGGWSAASNAAWLNLTGTASGSGSGTWTVPYSFDANPSSTSSRSAGLNFSGSFPTGSAFTLTQSPSATLLPNLTPYQPPGWSDKIVLSKVAGSTTDAASISPNDFLYLDWAVVNDGTASTPSLLWVDLYVDGMLWDYWYIDAGFQNGYYAAVSDYPLGALAAGTHTITIIADSTGNVAESNENDNQYTRTIFVGAAGGHPRRGDVNGDGRSDIVWRHDGTGVNYLYTMNGSTITSQGMINTIADNNWKIAAVADFNGDGNADLLWHNNATGDNYLYLMNGTAIQQMGYINSVADLNWQIVGVADYNGDGKADILWRHAVTGDNYLYLMNGFTIQAAGYLPQVSDLGWKVAASADFDGDGNADILWRHSTTGVNYLYLMNGLTIVSQGTINTINDANWNVITAADFDGDGKADILWRNSSTGANYLYRMSGVSILESGYINVVSDLNWTIAGNGDYDGDGRADILWRNTSTGENYMYLMNKFTIVSAGPLPQVTDPSWKIMR